MSITQKERILDFLDKNPDGAFVYQIARALHLKKSGNIASTIYRLEASGIVKREEGKIKLA